MTVMTDLTDPESPKVLAVARGKDTAAALKCLDVSPSSSRRWKRTAWTWGRSTAGCATRLNNSRLVVDRFHVAKQFNEGVDDLRKK